MNTNKSSTYGNKIIWFVAALLLAVLTITAVLKGGGVSPGELATDIRNLSIPGLLLAVSGMFGFIFFEGMALTVIVRGLGYPAKHRQGFVYSAADIYFSAITPSASGGQPASAFFMIRDGIPTTAVMAKHTTAGSTISIIPITACSFPPPGRRSFLYFRISLRCSATMTRSSMG